MIDKLTPEQEALIPVYREKWRAIALSTEPIDREKATDAVKAIYAAIGKQKPKIVFFDNPHVAYQNLLSRDRSLSELYDLIELEVSRQIEETIRRQLNNTQLWIEIERLFKIALNFKFSYQEENHFRGVMSDEAEREAYIFGVERGYIFGVETPKRLGERGLRMDYYISGLSISCKENQYKWELYQSLADNCGWIYTFEETCYVCDRPRILSFDSQQRLHAEGSPAIQFADGFSVYAYHGVRLPEKYGKVHPQQWRSEWLLSEDNAELRRVLIQGIGYDRICQELAAVEWVNWGIDPEEFAVQT